MNGSAERTIAQAVEDAALAETSRGFHFIGEQRPASYLSYTELEQETARWAGALQALGLRKGERLVLILPDNQDFIVCFLAAIRAGIIPVPVYPPLGLGQLPGYFDNTRHVVGKSGARAIVTTPKIRLLLGSVQAACPELRQVLTTDSLTDASEPLRPERVALDDVAFLQFTSGSTSQPKGVTVTHRNLAANIACIMQLGLQIRPEDVGISWLPLYHDMGLIGFVLAPLVHRVPIAYLPPLLFLKRPRLWLQTITRHRGTIAYAPNFAYAMCVKRVREQDLADIDLSSWRVAGCGAEPIRPETLEAFARAFGPAGFRREAFVPSYGMAESSLAVSFGGLGEGVRTLEVDGPALWTERLAKPAPERGQAVRLVSCGRAFAGHEIGVFALEDEASRTPLPDRCVGELRIAGPSVMSGYWRDAERTQQAFAGRYLRTGDLGFLVDGHVYVCGRLKEVLIVAGRNYYPQDLEWEATKVEGVRKGSVVAFGARRASGVELEQERVVVALESETARDAERIQAIVTAVRIAVQDGLGLAVDEVVVLAPGTLPKTSSGKLQRAKTRELYEAGQLASRASARAPGMMQLVKHTALSQLAYLKHAVSPDAPAQPERPD